MSTTNKTVYEIEATGVVDSAGIYMPDSGWGIVNLIATEVKIDGKPILPNTHFSAIGAKHIVPVKGKWMEQLAKGMEISVQGNKASYKGNQQIDMKTYQSKRPSDLHDTVLFLADRVGSVGKVTAQRIVDQFGADTYIILDRSPERLAEVKGISDKGAKRIAEQWKDMSALRDAFEKFSSIGLSRALTSRIVRHFDDDAYKAVKLIWDNPYALMNVKRIGFKKADDIAIKKMGVKLNDPRRLRGVMRYCLGKYVEQRGHTYVSIPMLVEHAKEELEKKSEQGRTSVPNSQLMSAIGDLVREEILTLTTLHQEQVVYRTAMYDAERGVAEHVIRLRDAPSMSLMKERVHPYIDALLNEAAAKQGVELTNEQMNAVRQALLSPVSILTGGPGTGKSTCLRALVDVMRKFVFKLGLAAPSGKAAKRLAEATGYWEGLTLHRMLMEQGKWAYNQANPVDKDFVIVDEFSMSDVMLTHRLLIALRSGSHIVFVGDTDQLPSVGAGNVLGDLITSGAIPVTRLTKIHRQAAKSKIIQSAHKIVKHQPIAKYKKETAHPDDDFFFFQREEDVQCLQTIKNCINAWITKKTWQAEDIQVLAGIRNGLIGVNNLNVVIREMLNPPSPHKKELKMSDEKSFRVEDRVMQTRNNYDHNIFNGEMFTIHDIVEGSKILLVEQGTGRQIELPRKDAYDLVHAYAITTHKSQGSEYPVVIQVCHTSYYTLLNTNWIYTGVTRAKKLCVVIGNKQGVDLAIRNRLSMDRRGGLVDWMKYYARK